jgi:exopolysaccharide biosynthesis polyprenyl glycosylphosphotransferase
MTTLPSLGPAAAVSRGSSIALHPGAPAVAGTSRRSAPLAAVLPLADAVALTAALTVASVAAGRMSWPGAAYPVTAFLCLRAAGLQHMRICLRVSDQIGRILAAVAAPVLVLLPWSSGPRALRLALWSAGLVLAMRFASTMTLRAARRRGYLAESAILVGAGPVGEQVLALLRAHPELGLRPCGFIGSGPPSAAPGMLLGGLADLADVVAAKGIRRVIVCPPGDREPGLAVALSDCRDLGAEACLVRQPGGAAAAVPMACLDEIWGIPIVPLRPRRAATAMLVKRAFDVTVAAMLLVPAAPLLGVLALIIKLRRRHSVLFRQLRVVGCDRTAEILKLRTMGEHPDADTCWVVQKRQLTSLGCWLRATHLDELPQLVNVLRGQMSLVGPRPERPYFVARFEQEIPRYADRLRMRAGLTGLAQVQGLHGDTSIRERVRFDNLYIDRWSLWLDIVILARTLARITVIPRPARASAPGERLTEDDPGFLTQGPM